MEGRMAAVRVLPTASVCAAVFVLASACGQVTDDSCSMMRQRLLGRDGDVVEGDVRGYQSVDL